MRMCFGSALRLALSSAIWVRRAAMHSRRVPFVVRRGPRGRIQISRQVNVAKDSDLTLEQTVAAANLSVYFAPGGVNDASSVRKSFGAVLDQAINRVMFTHVLEEVFLAPTKAARERLGSQCLGAGLTALHNTVNPHVFLSCFRPHLDNRELK